MRGKYTGRKVLSICSTCEHWQWIEELNLDVCGAANAAITDFINGLSLCADINESGECVLWRPRPECCCPDCQAKKNNAMSEDEINSLAHENGIN